MAKDALATIEALRRLPPPASADPQISLAEAAAADALTDSRRLRDAARRARAEGQARGARYLVGRALSLESAALFALGEAGEGMARNGEAGEVFRELGATRDQISIAIGRGWYQLMGAQLEEARSTLLGALELSRSAGYLSGAMMATTNLAVLALRRQEMGEAQRLNEAALAAARELDDRAQVGKALNNLGNVLHERGLLEEARARYEESLALRRELGESRGVVIALTNLAVVLREADDLAGAERAHAELRASAAGDQRIATASADLELGLLRLDQGRASEAVPILASAAAELEKSKRVDYAATALGQEARALEALGDRERALELARRALERAGQSENAREAYWTKACGLFVTGEEAALSRLAADTGSRGLVQVSLFARSLLARLEVKQHRAAASGHLAELERDARARGFLFIARQARELR
jgi:tetratricopeptide (TPR) repeat protein